MFYAQSASAVISGRWEEEEEDDDGDDDEKKKKNNKQTQKEEEKKKEEKRRKEKLRNQNEMKMLVLYKHILQSARLAF